MSTNVKPSDPKKPTLSEKALRLLAAHDREIESFESALISGKKAARWA